MTLALLRTFPILYRSRIHDTLYMYKSYCPADRRDQWCSSPAQLRMLLPADGSCCSTEWPITAMKAPPRLPGLRPSAPTSFDLTSNCRTSSLSLPCIEISQGLQSQPPTSRVRISRCLSTASKLGGFGCGLEARRLRAQPQYPSRNPIVCFRTE